MTTRFLLSFTKANPSSFTSRFEPIFSVVLTPMPEAIFSSVFRLMNDTVA